VTYRARLAAAAIAATAVAITVTGTVAALSIYQRQPAHSAPRDGLPLASSAASPHQPIRPATLRYVGVFERGAPKTYQPVRQFATVAGRKPNITVYYSAWGEPFRARFVTAAAQAGAVVLVHLEPRHQSMASIAAGQWDGYLHRFAAQVRRYGGQVILSFAPEPDGRWYPWGWHHTPAAEWIAAWRHVVTLFRDSGATNVTWLWDMSGVSNATGPVRDWWPGDEYVDWAGVDGYYFTRKDQYRNVIGKTVSDIREFASKPIMLSEVGIGPRAGKVAKMPGLFAGLRRDHLLGLIWFDVSQHRGLYHQDWRLEGHPAAVAAFQAGIATMPRRSPAVPTRRPGSARRRPGSARRRPGAATSR